jgi:hypothetical protein
MAGQVISRVPTRAETRSAQRKTDENHGEERSKAPRHGLVGRATVAARKVVGTGDGAEATGRVPRQGLA